MREFGTFRRIQTGRLFYTHVGILRRVLLLPQQETYGAFGRPQFLLITARDLHPRHMQNALALDSTELLVAGPLEVTPNPPIIAAFRHVAVARPARLIRIYPLLPVALKPRGILIRPILHGSLPIVIAELADRPRLTVAVRCLGVLLVLAILTLLMLSAPLVLTLMLFLLPGATQILCAIPGIASLPAMSLSAMHPATVLWLIIRSTAFLVPPIAGPRNEVTALVGTAMSPPMLPLMASPRLSSVPVLNRARRVSVLLTGPPVARSPIGIAVPLFGAVMVLPIVVPIIPALGFPLLRFVAQLNRPASPPQIMAVTRVWLVLLIRLVAMNRLVALPLAAVARVTRGRLKTPSPVMLLAPVPNSVLMAPLALMAMLRLPSEVPMSPFLVANAIAAPPSCRPIAPVSLLWARFTIEIPFKRILGVVPLRKH